MQQKAKRIGQVGALFRVLCHQVAIELALKLSHTTNFSIDPNMKTKLFKLS